MSPRKVGKSIRIDEDTHKKLWKYSQSKHLDMTIIVGNFIAQGVEYDIFDGDWAKKARGDNARFAFLDDACGHLAYAKKKKDDPEGWFKCIWARDGKPPQVLNLSEDADGARDLCAKCTKHRLQLEGIIGYEEQIKVLKATVKKGAIVDVPSCVRGGRLSDDGKSLYCQQTAKYSKVERCKTLRNGANCKELRWSRIEMKGKLPEKTK